MGKVVGLSKVSTKFQITIPAEVRKKHGIMIGDKIMFKEENGTLLIIKV